MKVRSRMFWNKGARTSIHVLPRPLPWLSQNPKIPCNFWVRCGETNSVKNTKMSKKHRNFDKVSWFQNNLCTHSVQYQLSWNAISLYFTLFHVCGPKCDDCVCVHEKEGICILMHGPLSSIFVCWARSARKNRDSSVWNVGSKSKFRARSAPKKVLSDFSGTSKHPNLSKNKQKNLFFTLFVFTQNLLPRGWLTSQSAR